ncbi:predicted protein [Paramuricea clavata]|uniref:Activation-induced cytidine deaminase AID domain-containing protein n=1 Tax=Paramuricea clavata TaxID=317549 RepID=A0A7D9I150_PARCT|nr:predicted protein [Paramuricea clavata]
MAEAQNEAPTLSPSTTNDSNLSDSLFKNGSDFKWDGTFEKLKSFVKTTLSLNGIWSSPKANTEKFTTKSKMNHFSITITFHSTTKTLQIQGKKKDSETLKKHLLKLVMAKNPREPANDECSRECSLVVQSVGTSSSSEIESLDGDENKCNGQCSEIYPIQNEHIKQRVGILGSKDQFCAAFYHVHKWGTRKRFCLDKDNCIIAQKKKKRIKNFEDDVKKFGGKAKKCVKESDQLVTELKELAKKPKRSYQEANEEFVERAIQFAQKAEKPPDEKTLEQFRKTARKAVYAWCVQAKTVVAVVKFEKDKNILYEARYTNCGEEQKQKHAEDFFKEDIEKGELGKKVEANPNGTITLYLTIQPCNKSTSIKGTANTPAEKTCCKTLTTIVNKILPPEIKLCVKAANTCRLSLTKEKDPDDETLRKNAVDGIKMLMQVGVDVSGMTKEDWDYLLAMTNPDVPRQYDARRKDLDKSVQETFTGVKDQLKKQSRTKKS